MFLGHFDPSNMSAWHVPLAQVYGCMLFKPAYKTGLYRFNLTGTSKY